MASPPSPDGSRPDGSRAHSPRPKRWGVRALAFLAVAAASIIVSNVLYAQGNQDFVLLTFLGTVGGLVGAAVCSIRGVKAWRASP
jgi:hypothetical protein